MTVTLLAPPASSWLDGSGDPLNGGLIYAYQAGTTTAKNTYPTHADATAGTNANANPVVLDSAGRAQIWLDGTYKIVVKTSADVTVATYDVVGSASSDSLALDHVSGLTVTLDTDTAHDVNVTAGEARDGADSEDIVLSSEITKQIDATWAVGDDAGGLDTGTVANVTAYYVWLIKRTDTNVVDVLLSTSSTAPTMPDSYDKKVLIGVGKTDGSANFVYVANANRSVRLDTGGDVAPTINLHDLALVAEVFS